MTVINQALLYNTQTKTTQNIMLGISHGQGLLEFYLHLDGINLQPVREIRLIAPSQITYIDRIVVHIKREPCQSLEGIRILIEYRKEILIYDMNEKYNNLHIFFPES